MNSKNMFLYGFLMLFAGLGTVADARAPYTAGGAAKRAQDELSGEQALININNLSMWFKNDGWSARHPLTGNSGVRYPRGTDYAIYADGLIFGGYVRDGVEPALRVGGQTYAVGTQAGRIVSKGVADAANARIFRVRADYATANLQQDAEEMGVDTLALRAQYERDWNQWPAPLGAPFYDVDGNGSYDPAVDAPAFRNADCTVTPDVCASNADQIAWFVMNDLDEGKTASLYGSPPIGMEIQVTLWAYARTDALGEVIFKKYRFEYKGTASTPDDAMIEDFYVAQWSDPDLGNYGDDFAGCDIDLSLGYVYNGADNDSKYAAHGLAPPAAGYDFLQGPIVPVLVDVTDDDGNVTQAPDPAASAIFDFEKITGYRNLPMTSYVYFAAGSSISDPSLGEYDGTLEWYNLLQGYQPQPDVDNPVPYTNPITGEDAKFTLDGDPTRATGWNDGVTLPPGDRRIVLNTGPFEMQVGDVQEVVVALIAGLGSDRLRSVSKLKFNDLFVQDAYNNFFQVPPPPASPKVRVVEFDGAIVLDWGWDQESVEKTENIFSGSLEFEGYNIYQLPSAQATLGQGQRLATFDKQNGITTILGISLDDNSGVILDVPQQIGNDLGVKRNFLIKRDALRGGPLVNGQKYYFAVTAYSHNKDETAATTTLESTLGIEPAVPQWPLPGKRYGSVAFESLLSVGEDSLISHVGDSEGYVAVTVINPMKAKGLEYLVTFRQDGEGNQVWDLKGKDVDANETAILLGESEIGPDDERKPIYVPDHGFDIMVLGPPLALSGYEWEGSPAPWFTGVDWGGSAIHGGAAVGSNFFGSSLGGADLKTVEIRFSVTDTQLGYRYLRGGDPNYGYQDFGEVPFTAWEVDSDPPRQVNVAFVENSGSTSENGRWDLASDDADRNVGGREYLFILNSDYSATALERYTSKNVAGDAAELDTQAALWLKLDDGGEMDMLEDGQVLRLIPYRVNSTNDVFSFKVTGEVSSESLLTEDLKKINVFPNPYYALNPMETSRYEHFVTFSHLPAQATIRIFDVAGHMVRKLEKQDPGAQFITWDLNNDNNLPVASGIYVAHIEMPGAKAEKVLKVAIVQEQQFLESY